MPEAEVAAQNRAELLKKLEDAELAHREEEATAYAFLAFMVSLQVAVYIFKRKQPKRFQEITLVFMWLYPLMIVYKNQDWHTGLLLVLWAVWSSRTLKLVYEAQRRPLKADIPQQVYTWFLGTHNVCYFSGTGAIYLFLFFPDASFMVLFLSLYFAVLGRDFAEISAERISSTIGYTKYETPPPNLCALCGEELKPTLQMLSGEVAENDTRFQTYTLPCSHEFHATCIMGWCIVGKKQTCPFCMEKVDLKSLIPDWAWNSKHLSVLWMRLLDVLRFLVVWNPIIVYLDLFLLKIFHFKEIPPHNNEPGPVIS